MPRTLSSKAYNERVTVNFDNAPTSMLLTNVSYITVAFGNKYNRILDL